MLPIESLWQDVRYGWRSLWRAPVVTLVAILSLALGIGANTAIFTLVKATLLQPLAIPEPERVYQVYWSEQPGRSPDFASLGFRAADFRRLRDAAAPLGTIAASGTWGWTVDARGVRHSALLLLVSPEYFDVVAVPPALGRWFTPDEYRHAAPVAILSNASWKTTFGGDPNAIGQTLTVNDRPFTIVGVASPELRFSAAGGSLAAVLPLSVIPAIDRTFDFLDDGSVRPEVASPMAWLSVVMRLAPGVAPEQVEARFRALAPTPEDRARGRDRFSASLVPASRMAVPLSSRAALVRFLALLSGTVALVLLIGCANVASVMLARAEQRRREMAVRATLGAGRGRLLRQLLTESVLFAGIGGACGLMVSFGLLRALEVFSLPGVSVAGLALEPDAAVLAFAAGAALVTALVCGLAPSWHGARVDLVNGLKSIGTTSGRGRSRARGLLLGAQVALSIVLLVGAGLFIRSVQRGLSADLGYRPQNLVLADYSLDPQRFDEARHAEFRSRLVARVRQLPGVSRAAIGAHPLRMTSWGTRITVDGQQFTVEDGKLRAAYVDPGYIETLGLRLMAGRTFTDRDLAAPRVAVVNEAFASRFIRSGSALGHRVEALSWDPRIDKGPPSLEIVGVVANARFQDLRATSTPALYLLRGSQPGRGTLATLIVRGTGRVEALMAAVAHEIRALAPDEPPPALTTVDAQLARLLLPERMGATLLGWFSALAVLLSILGTYGIVAYAVTRRTTEIGIRMAMGATPRHIVTSVLQVGVLPVMAGTIVGLAAAWHITRLAQQFLFEVSPRDAVSFAGAGVLLLAVAAVAAWLPARRAVRVDPAVALRAE